jgi:REP element-mobilizing transposase RayT
MPRLPRIQFPNAFYHIINRGKDRKNIFHNERYFQLFLDLIAKSHEKYGIIIHAYCLMTNHYHLLIETPNSNISDAMKYINGIYAQKYNFYKKEDGSPFNGRYKAILVDDANYLATLNKYIHRNPIEIKSCNKLVQNLSDYKWSSYRAYLNIVKRPKWLDINKTLNYLNLSKTNYINFIENLENDENTTQFYQKDRQFAIMGDEDFKDKVLKFTNSKRIKPYNRIRLDLTFAQLINAVSLFYKISDKSILYKSDCKKENLARKLAIYLCQKDLGYSLKKIATLFNLKKISSVSYAIKSINQISDIDDIINKVRKFY